MATLITPPLNDGTSPVSGRTDLKAQVYPQASVVGSPTVVLTGLAQQPDNTVIVDDPSILSNEKYFVGLDEPKADPAQAYRGAFRLMASGAPQSQTLEDGATEQTLEDGATTQTLEG